MKTTIKKLRRLGIVSQLEDKTMKIERRRFTEFAAVALIIMATILFAVGQAQWDLNPGGVAFAKTVAAPAFASSEMETYQLHLEVPQVSQAANGDVVSIAGDGVFFNYWGSPMLRRMSTKRGAEWVECWIRL